MNAADILAAAGLTVTQTMTTPSRPGKKPRPVWEVRGKVSPWDAIFRGLGGRPWRGAFSFFEDPSDAIADALQSESADEQLTGTYRDRRETRAERLQEWSEKRKTKSAAAFKTARTIADGIPLGQPILVGHHSERHHRRDIGRIDSNMRKGCEHEQKAAEMSSRAANIEAAAEAAIYSDDVDALEKMRARVAGLEAERDRIKACNKAIRKHGLQRLTQADPPFELTRDELAELLKLMQITPYHKVDERGFPTYALTNLGGNITRNRGRLQEMERKAEARARVRAVLAGERAIIADAAITADMIGEQDFDEHNQPRPPADVPLVISFGSTVIHRTAPADPVQAVADEIAEAEAHAAPLAEVPFSLTPTHECRTPHTRGLF